MPPKPPTKLLILALIPLRLSIVPQSDSRALKNSQSYGSTNSHTLTKLLILALIPLRLSIVPQSDSRALKNSQSYGSTNSHTLTLATAQSSPMSHF